MTASNVDDPTPLRTALLTWNYPPVPTGLGRAAEAIAQGLVEVGADVTVFSADRPRGCTKVVGGVRVIGCAVAERGAAATMCRRACIGHLVAPEHFAGALHREHARMPFDLVEATNWYAPAVRILHRLRRWGVPLVVRHSTPAKITTEAASVRDRLDLGFAHRLEAQAVRAAALSIYNTLASREVLRAHYGLPVSLPSRVIGLALPDELIACGAAAPFALPGEGEPLTLAFIGRAETRKGFAETIAAAALLAHRREVTLHLCGTDPGEEARALGGDRPTKLVVVNHGRAPDETLHRVLSSAHLVLAPSRSESYGIVYREAAAFGRPLVASATDASAREFIAGTGAGVLAERTDPHVIAGAVETLLSSPAALLECRAKGLAHARTLTREALGRATLSAYHDTLHRFASA